MKNWNNETPKPNPSQSPHPVGDAKKPKQTNETKKTTPNQTNQQKSNTTSAPPPETHADLHLGLN